MKNKGNLIIIVLVGLIYTALLMLYFYNFYDGTGFAKDNGKWGTFGDFLGGALSPIVGIISIVFTYKIINNQIAENKQTEFKYMFEILFSAITEKKKMIEFKYREKQLNGDKKEVVANDIKAIDRINGLIESLYRNALKTKPDSEPLKSLQVSFWEAHEEINRSSAPYMKNLHNCLKIIDKNCVNERKKEYADLIRAQLSKEELIFIFYNAIADEAHKNFKSRIEKYSILKDICNHPFEPILRSEYLELAFVEGPEFDYQRNFSIYKRNYSFEFKFSRN
ncbi:MAG: putative phage abortive infection protein [Bacteroidia bacterium]